MNAQSHSDGYLHTTEDRGSDGTSAPLIFQLKIGNSR